VPHRLNRNEQEVRPIELQALHPVLRSRANSSVSGPSHLYGLPGARWMDGAATM
jgi:hypothetical protein